MTIGKRIKKLREDFGLTLEQVATELGVATQTVFKYESGIITNIPSERLEKLAGVLKTTPGYLLGWRNDSGGDDADDCTPFPVMGTIAAGFDKVALEDWSGDRVNIPNSYLRGYDADDFLVLQINGDSMYPTYSDGDRVLIRRQASLDYSGQVGAVIYDDCATLKKVEFNQGENWLRLIPINPLHPPKKIENEELERCRILGVPRLLIREIDD